MPTALNSMDADVPGDEKAVVPRSAGGRRPRNHINASTIIIIGACVIGALWLIISVVIEDERQAALMHARGETNSLSAAFKMEIEGKLDTIGESMDFIASRIREGGDFDVYRWGREHPPLTGNVIRAIGLIAPDGTLLSTSRQPRAPAVNLADRDYVKVQLDGSWHGPYVGQPGEDGFSGLDGIAISRRVETPDGRLLAIIVASLGPEQLSSLHDKADLGPHAKLSLIGFDHIIRARFGPSVNGVVPGIGRRVPPLPEPMAPGSPPQSFIRAASVDHVTRIYTARPLDGYPLYVVAAFDLDAVLGPVSEHAAMIDAIGVLASVVLTGVALLLLTEIGRGAKREVRLANERTRLDTEVRRGLEVQQKLRASEQRLRDYAVMASDWLWEQDADLRFTEIGMDAPIRYGGSQIGQRRWEVNDTSQAPELWAAHERDVRAHKPFRDFRFCLTGDDGKPHHISLNGIPVHDDLGRFAGYRGTGRDVTTEVAAEAELRAAKNRAEQAETLLRDAVDSMSEGFVIFDSEDRFVMCNEAYRRHYDVPGLDLLVPGTPFEDIVRHSLATGGNIDARGREEDWLAERMRHHRDGTGAMQNQVRDGSWILATDRRMKNGGTAGLRVNITALKETKDALRDSEVRLERAQAIAGVGSWELDVATGQYIWSKELYRIRGLSPSEFDPNMSNVGAYLHPDEHEPVRCWLDDLIAGRDRDTRETMFVRPDGEVRTLRVEGQAIRDADGVVRRVAGTMQDVTERRLIERQLAQAQKMEAIGTLTGGMAHDFNNGLGVIIGNLDLLRRMIDSNGMAAEVCDEAREAALRCADLIRGLLAFARRQPLQPRQTDVNALVKGTSRLLARSLGSDIALNLSLSATLWPALADAAQLEAALINLATNARDAMPKGGQLRIATRNATLDARQVALQPEATAGEYVLIEVTDTGTGIAPEILGSIFEPFFTTKQIGSGSGLGLAMVFGFIKQSGGHIDVFSEPGCGTTFRLWLPRASAADLPAAAEAAPRVAIGGDETILLVEDNTKLRQVAARQLGELGYRVVEAENAEQALRIVSSGGPVDLLFTDVVMPGALDGMELAALVSRLRPAPAILLASGFSAARGAGDPPSPPGFRLLTKPYSLDDLAHAVRDLLDARRRDIASDAAQYPAHYPAEYAAPDAGAPDAPALAGTEIT